MREATQGNDVPTAEQTRVEPFGQHHRQSRRPRPWVQSGQGIARQGDGAGQWALQAGDRPEQCRFPRTVGAQQDGDPPGGGTQVQSRQDDLVRSSPTSLVSDRESLQHKVPGASLRAESDWTDASGSTCDRNALSEIVASRNLASWKIATRSVASRFGGSSRRRHAAPAASVRLRSNAMTTTGAPMAAVTTLSGSTPSLPGSCASTAHSWQTTAPINTAAGTSSR